VNDLEHGNSGPNDQQRLVAGMLDRDNLLDIIRTFSMKGIPQSCERLPIRFWSRAE
jgi:type I restriction enzyme R subunit